MVITRHIRCACQSGYTLQVELDTEDMGPEPGAIGIVDRGLVSHGVCLTAYDIKEIHEVLGTYLKMREEFLNASN